MSDDVDGAPTPASRLSVSPVAVRNITRAGGKKLDRRLTSLMALAVSRTSGAIAVPEHAAHASLDACGGEPGCQTPEMNDFLRARWIVHARVDQLGSSHFASGSVWDSVKPFKRVSKQHEDRDRAAIELGWALGEAIRPLLERAGGE